MKHPGAVWLLWCLAADYQGLLHLRQLAVCEVAAHRDASAALDQRHVGPHACLCARKMQLELKLSSEKSAHDIEQCQPRHGLSSSVTPRPTWRWYTMSPMRTSWEECQNCTQQNLHVNINATMLQQHGQIRRHICHVSLALWLEDDDAAAVGSCPAK